MLLQRLKVLVTETDLYHWQEHFQTVEDEAKGSDTRGGMKPLYAHDGVEEIPPPLFWEDVYKRLRAVSLTTRGWKLAGGWWNEEISEICSRLTAQECTVRRCGGPATFTHTTNRSDPRLDRAGVKSRLLGWRIVCRLLLTSINKDELVYNLGRQSLDSVRPRHLLRTGKKKSCWPKVGYFLFNTWFSSFT